MSFTDQLINTQHHVKNKFSSIIFRFFFRVVILTTGWFCLIICRLPEMTSRIEGIITRIDTGALVRIPDHVFDTSRDINSDNHKPVLLQRSFLIIKTHNPYKYYIQVLSTLSLHFLRDLDFVQANRAFYSQNLLYFSRLLIASTPQNPPFCLIPLVTFSVEKCN